MILALLCIGLQAAIPQDSPLQTADLTRLYREARAHAGRSSEEQVRLALWCEAHGLTRERLVHLAQAALADPTNATARGLMGLVAHEGRFLRPEAVAEKVHADPAQAEYDARRAEAPYTAEGQWAMGVWAEGRGLKDQARAHFTAVTRLDPSREAAWKRLGYKKQAGRWTTDAQLADERARAEAQKQADRRWKPILEGYRDALQVPGRRVQAEEALAQLADPRAVPSIWAVFVGAGAPGQALAVRLFGQIEGALSSRALTELAIRAGTPEVRRLATETLARRDPREFVGQLVARVRRPLKYEVRPLNGPGSPGVLFVEGERYNVRRFYAQPPPPAEAGLPRLFTDDVPFDPWGRQGMAARAGQYTDNLDMDPWGGPVTFGPVRGSLDFRMLVGSGGFSPLGVVGAGPLGAFLPNPIDLNNVAVQRDALIGGAIQFSQEQAEVVRNRLAGDVEAIEARNAAIRDSNVRVLAALKAVTGKDLGEDPEAWQRWRSDQEGYAYRSAASEKPTISEFVFIPGVTPVAHSCFGAGTPVRTIGGDRPIEALRPGDRVLSQDTRTGSLSFRPVLAVHHNPPDATLRIGLGGDEVVATGIHRFWKAGHGWVMARDLREGDPVRTLGGVSRVEAIRADRVQPVFNLEVAEGHDFLVGKVGALVHDNSLVEPELAPFDAPTEVAAGKPGR